MKLDNKVLAALGAAKPAGKDEPDKKNSKKAKASKPEPAPADKADAAKKPDDAAGKADDAKKADDKKADDAAAAAAAVDAIIDESMKGIASDIGDEDDKSAGSEADKPEPAGKIVRKNKTENNTEEDNGMSRTMESMDFYEKLGNEAFDYDRGFGLSGDLRGWIKKVIATDSSLIKEFISEDLEEAIRTDSDLLKSAKKTVAAVESSMVPYVVLFASKLDGTEYEDKDEAEASIAQYKAIGATFNSSFTKVYRRIENGEIGGRVRIDEVKDFIEQFSGDKDALRQRLFISNKK